MAFRWLGPARAWAFAVFSMTLVVPGSAASPGEFEFDRATFEGSVRLEFRDGEARYRADAAGGPAGRGLELGRAALVVLPDGSAVRGARLRFDAASGDALTLSAEGPVVATASVAELHEHQGALRVHLREGAPRFHGSVDLRASGGVLVVDGERTVALRATQARPLHVALRGALLDPAPGPGGTWTVLGDAVALTVSGTVALERARGTWEGEPRGGTFVRVGSTRLVAEPAGRDAPAAGETAEPPPAEVSRFAAGAADVVRAGGDAPERAAAPRRASAASVADAGGAVRATLHDARPAALAAPSSDGPPLAALAAGALVVATLAAALQKGKSALFALLGARLKRHEVPTHPARARLLDLLRAQPGMRLAELERATGLVRNTVEYHLTLLRRAGHVESRVRYGSTRWFLHGHAERVADGDLARAVLRRSRLSGEILRAVEERPGVSVGEVSQRLRLHPSHTMYHLRKLLAADLLDARKEGRVRRLYPPPAAPPRAPA